MQQRVDDSHTEQRLTHTPAFQLQHHKSVHFRWIFFFFSVISIPASFKITGDGVIWEGLAEKVGVCL